MATSSKNIRVFAILSAQAPDTSGEVMNIKNADISSLKTGNAPLNTEHKNPEDVEKSKENEKTSDKDFKGFSTIIGRVISAKKLFSAEDCENDFEKRAWASMEIPMIVGILEFFDDPGNPNAQAACALIRQAEQNGFDHMIGFSVEGNVLKREGNQLVETVIRRIAATLKPCFKGAQIQAVIQDTPSRSDKPDVITKASQDGTEFLSNYNNERNFYVLPDDFGLSVALMKLKKALTAGGMDAAPSSLTGGAALQSSSHLNKLEKLFGSKPASSAAVKKALPTAKPEDVEKIVHILKHRRLKKHEQEFEEIYSKLFK